MDLILIVAIIALLLNEAAKGTVSAEAAAFLMVGLVVLAAVARAFRMSLVRFVFSVGLPLTGLIVFIIWQSTNDREMMANFATTGTILIMLFGLYLMFRGVLGGRRNKNDDD